MTIRLYNTMTKAKEEFVPLDPMNVRMYVCGPTVYDYAHIGNARPAIVFDVLFRLLRHTYGDGHVTYVRNITDIDDKINARAAERAAGRNAPILDVLREITEATYGVYRGDVTALGCLPPTHMPRATEYVAPMIAMTQTLIGLGYAYAAEGHVLFRVKKKTDYGKLARRSLDDMLAGARVDVAPYKEDPMDFVLWKPSTPDQPGWDSPWGYGRPGWHLECSAMIEAIFKGSDTIDIHGGGIDLVFPHHENEIAQSESAHHGHPLARVWMHNGFLNVEGDKMSKSLGNFVTIRELLETKKFGGRKWPGTILRTAMLTTHYRQPIDWTLDRLQEAQSRLTRWLGPPTSRGVPERSKVSEEFISVISDDMDFNMGFILLDELAAQSRSPSDANPRDIADQIAATLLWLGLATDADFAEARADTEDLKATIRAAAAGLNKEDILTAIEARKAARARKDFKESDRIRDDLLAQGIVLKDGPSGTTWEVKR